MGTLASELMGYGSRLSMLVSFQLLVTEALLQKERAEADMAEARIREEFEARERSIEEKIRARKAAHGGNTAAEADDDILQALIAELKVRAQPFHSMMPTTSTSCSHRARL